jgi:RNA polymerase sigma factor (sigma-70 family)
MEEQTLFHEELAAIPNRGSVRVDPAWQEQMVLQYAPLIKYIASRLALRLPSHISQDDLVSSGIIGLMDAIQKFDPSKNINFKTYAEFRIKGAMLDELRSLDWTPRSVRKKSHLLENAYAQLQKSLGRPAEAESWVWQKATFPKSCRTKTSAIPSWRCISPNFRKSWCGPSNPCRIKKSS